jgi:acyl-CoA thioester hydrolase
MSSVFTSERRVEFCETDAAGIAHFSSLIIFMEQAEHALLRHLGLSVASSSTSNPSSIETSCSWPRVHVECDFQSSVKFEDVLSIETTLSKLGTKSLSYSHRILRGSELVATGSMSCVCCRRVDGQLVSIAIPDGIRTLLKPYLKLI